MFDDQRIALDLDPHEDLEEAVNDNLANQVKPTPLSSAYHGAEVNTAVHDGVFGIFIGLFAAILAVFYLTFSQSGESVFMIAICAFYGAMYFGAPALFRRISKEKRRRKDWSSFLSEPLSTNTGMISGRAALLQICLVPAALTICVTGICIIVALVR